MHQASHSNARQWHMKFCAVVPAGPACLPLITDVDLTETAGKVAVGWDSIPNFYSILVCQIFNKVYMRKAPQHGDRETRFLSSRRLSCSTSVEGAAQWPCALLLLMPPELP